MPAGIFGPLVAAAGNISGGLAAQAIMGDTSAPPGGGIPGLTTSQGYGKNHDQGTAIQVDPSTALSYFNQAAKEQESSYRKGLQYYASSLAVAGRQMQSAYLDANSTLKPLSQASNDALNEQLKMMGMDPISATVSYADRADFAGQTEIGNLMRQAEKIEDTAERAVMRKKIMDTAKQLSDTSEVQKRITALGARPSNPNGWTEEEMAQGFKASLTGPSGSMKQYATDFLTQKTTAENQKYSQMSYDQQLAALNAELAKKAAYGKTATELANRWDSEYEAEKGRGYTGEEATERLEQTPGYQFQMTQGTKAIARSQAARGMLRSGNTQLGIQSYGQGLAEQTFNTYMDRLSGIVAQGSGATGQISANQIAEGDYLASLTQQGGLAAMETERAIGDYTANSLVHSGDTFIDVSKFNANAQNQAISQMRATKSDQIVAGQNAGVGAMNAATNRGALGLAQQSFNYGIQKNNQVGAGYYSGGQGYYGGSRAPVYGRDFVSQGGSYITG